MSDETSSDMDGINYFDLIAPRDIGQAIAVFDSIRIGVNDVVFGGNDQGLLTDYLVARRVSDFHKMAESGDADLAEWKKRESSQYVPTTKGKMRFAIAALDKVRSSIEGLSDIVQSHSLREGVSSKKSLLAAVDAYRMYVAALNDLDAEGIASNRDVLVGLSRASSTCGFDSYTSNQKPPLRCMSFHVRLSTALGVTQFNVIPDDGPLEIAGKAYLSMCLRCPYAHKKE